MSGARKEATLSPAEMGSVKDPLLGTREKQTLLGLPIFLVAGIFYCTASTSMVLLNKAALSSFTFYSFNSLLFTQCLVSVLAVQACSLFGVIKLEPFSWKIVKLWYPVNIIFVGMIWTGFLSLKKLGVPMITVLKNLSNLFTICGDFVFYGKVYGPRVWSTLGLMGLSAFCGAATDLEFSMEGYIWQIVNCLFTAAYSLYLRGVMDSVAHITVHKTKLDELSMVWYNNMLSLPLIAALIFFSGEVYVLPQEAALRDPWFLAAASASCIVAFGVSFASLWFLSTTAATMYSLVGSLNKIPIAVIGLVAFNVAWTYPNLLSVGVGLLASVVFAWTKQEAK